MRDKNDRNWGPQGQSDLNQHWRVSLLILLGIGGALWLGVFVWFAMLALAR